MELRLVRRTFTTLSTIGDLYIDGVKECFTLEDKVRNGPKIPGKTAIPEGRYSLVLDFSEKFQTLMPHILNVPGFEGIRIHSGNSDKDTSGCILVGQTETSNFVGNSKAAFGLLFSKLLVASRIEKLWIEITHKQLEIPVPITNQPQEGSLGFWGTFFALIFKLFQRRQA